jgi:hypothetical protein
MTHPITPPPELVQQWIQQSTTTECAAFQMATRAAQWGADQELEECIEWLCTGYSDTAKHLRIARRPKPPSLKEQALQIIERGEDDWQPLPEDWATLRRALEDLPDDAALGE